MHRYFLELAYKGTHFHGWQIQNNAHSIQEEVQQALTTSLGQKTAVVGCGRTDSGVHALKYYAHFDSTQVLDNHLCFKLNGILPRDIAVYKLIVVNDDAHARFDATSRTYEYHLHRYKDPFLTDRSAFIPHDLNLNLMEQGCQLLLDNSDFGAFCKSGSHPGNTLCDLQIARVERVGAKIIFYFTANRFLRNMVRAMVGTLVDLGRASIDIEEFKEIIASKDRKRAGMSVDACGLYLVGVEYPFL